MLNGKRALLAVLFIIGIAAFAYFAMPRNQMDVSTSTPLPGGRLSQDVVPTSYILDLKIDPRELTFSGKVEIAIDINKATNLIWLHGVDISVNSAALEYADGTSISGTYQQVDQTGVAQINLDGVAPQGQARLVIDYAAPFNRSLEGIYKVVEREQSYVFSQFEATSARFAFPGFDDPQFKTPYKTSLTIPSEMEGVTNALEISERPADEGWKRIDFAETPPLPTYLLAFAIGPLDIVEWEDIPPTELRQSPLRLRGVTAQGKGDKIHFALENTAKILETLEAYFGVAYPYDKLDIIAAPDFSAGAMENAGAIIYREQRMLMDDTTSLNIKRAYFGTHAHELAHMWFGDYVTPVWWDDIWLNESFATWMSYKALSIAYPEDGFDGVLADRMYQVFDADSQITARQVRNPINSNGDIGMAFDGITYSKGGAILSMFENFMGEDAFREGIRTHMNRFPHGNANVFDFLDSLEQGSGNTNIRSAFSSFILQPGIPHIAISGFESDDTGTRLNYTMKRYFPLGSDGQQGQTWELPLCLVIGTQEDRTNVCSLVSAAEGSLAFPNITNATFVFPNAEGVGYYRWEMEDDLWPKLMQNLTALNVTERKSLFDSAFSNFKAGEGNVDTMLDVLSLLGRDSRWDVADKTMDAVRELDASIVSESAKGPFMEMVREIYSGHLSALGLWPYTAADERDPIGTALLRNDVVEILAESADHIALRADLASMAKALVGFGGDGNYHPEVINPDLVDTALKVGVEELGPDYFDHLVMMMDNSVDALFRQDIISALIRTKDDAKVQALLALMVDQRLRDNEARQVYQELSESAHADALWNWLQTNIDMYVDRLPTWRKATVINIGKNWCAVGDVERLRSFFEPLVTRYEGGELTLSQAIETIELCNALREKWGPSFDLKFTGGDKQS